MPNTNPMTAFGFTESQSMPGPVGLFYTQLDQSRRRLGHRMDEAGLGPVRTPGRTLMTRPGVRLEAFIEADAEKTPVLLVPAPIKRSYLWDLEPEISVVRSCLDAGLAPYLIHWEPPENGELGLEDFGLHLIELSLKGIERETGEASAFVAGHSLGGTLAAIFAALRPEQVRGLVLLEAPLCFDEQGGALANVAHQWPQWPVATGAEVPGSLLSTIAMAASPTTFGWARWMDWLESLTTGASTMTHLRAERWMLDEVPMPRRLFDEVVELLYREDQLSLGVLNLAGERVTPERVTAPICCVASSDSPITPLGSLVPFLDASGSEDVTMLRYGGDVGVALQHLGPLVGRSAHQELWPSIWEWIDGHEEARQRAEKQKKAADKRKKSKK